MRAHCSIAYLPSIPAYAAVPQAMMTMRWMSLRLVSGSSSVQVDEPVRDAAEQRVLDGFGSSLISFAMKLDQPPFSEADASQLISNSSALAGSPAKSMISTKSGRIVTIWSLPERDRAAGVLDEGGDVRAEEVLAVAESDHERGVAAGAHDDTGRILVQHEQGEGAVQPVDDAAEGLGEVAGVLVLLADHDRRDLGVGVAVELDALRLELGLEVGEVLDDAVVDERQLAVVAEMRVGVAVGGSTVGRPAGAPDAGGAVGDGMRIQVVHQNLQLAGALRRAEVALAGRAPRRPRSRSRGTRGA